MGSTDSLATAGVAGKALAHLAAFQPVLATEKGITSLDGQLPCLAPEAIDLYVAGARAHLSRIAKALEGKPDTAHTIDLLLAAANLRVSLLWLTEIRWHEVNPLVFVEEALNGVFALLLQEHRPLHRRLAAIMARLEAFERFLGEGQRHLREPWKLFVELAAQTAREGESFLIDLAHAHPELRAAVNNARRALDRFERFLQRSLGASQDRIALGPDLYAKLLAYDHFLTDSPHDLEAIGQRAVIACQERARREPPLPAAVVSRAPASFGSADALEYYRWEIAQVSRYFREARVVPEPAHDHLSIVESPPFMAALLPTVCYQGPPPFSGGRRGILFLGPLPGKPTAAERRLLFAEKKFRTFRKEIVHELYPGHHLQMLLAAEHPSPVRRFQANDLFVEGWALYCEELAERMGLYADRYVSSLFPVFFRAARVVIDTRLQTGRWGIEDAVGYLTALFGTRDADWFRREVHRYLSEPGQALTYLIGKDQIDRMAAARRARAGRRFSLLDFHTDLLGEGSIPPALVEAALLDRRPRIPRGLLPRA